MGTFAAIGLRPAQDDTLGERFSCSQLAHGTSLLFILFYFIKGLVVVAQEELV